METNSPTIQMVFNVTNENKMSLITKDINPRAKQFFSDTYYFVFTLYTSTGLENNSFLCPKRYLKGERVSNSSVLSSWQLCLCQGISLLGHIIYAWWRKWLKWIQQNLAKTQTKKCDWLYWLWLLPSSPALHFQQQLAPCLTYLSVFLPYVFLYLYLRTNYLWTGGGSSRSRNHTP